VIRPGARRVLVVDDDPGVRLSYGKVLGAGGEPDKELGALRGELFADDGGAAACAVYQVDLAAQGQEAAALLQARLDRGESYGVAFVDMRMPPGWDGLRTAEELWRLDEELQLVFCTAYSDWSWSDAARRLGRADRFLVLKKPFDAVEVQQLAAALCSKRALTAAAALRRTELEQLVAARTHELADALATAEAATRAKSEFLANTSHEIRTPMTAILGFAELMRTPDLPAAALHEHLEVIRRNGEHLLAILNDVLDLSKIEAGEMSVERLATPVPEILADIASLMRVKAAGKQLQFEFAFDTAIPERIASDPTRLRQILLNLVANAIKFTDRGGVQLRARLLATAAQPVLQISVRDSGIGITAEQRQRLFRSFAQADASTARRYGGTGLGLVISGKLARLLGGDIALESAPESGSTFVLSLPTGPLDGVQLVHDPHELPAPGPAPAPAQGRLPCRILLAEDGPDNQRLIQAIFAQVGATVVVAENGVLACEAAQRSLAAGQPFDLVLMDMQMPRMDGYEATQALRAAGWQRPIVALTAHAMAGDRERCLAIGCDAYETKPVHRAHLLETCRSLLGR